MKIFYPVPYAAQKWGEYGLDETEINRLIADGELDTHLVELDGKDLTVIADSDIRNIAAERIDRAQFAHLEGIEINSSDAAKKYSFYPTSLLRWAALDYIKVLRRQGKTIYLNEADVAFARKRADVKELKSGQSLF